MNTCFKSISISKSDAVEFVVKGCSAKAPWNGLGASISVFL
jgi:hypothetical protein